MSANIHEFHSATYHLPFNIVCRAYSKHQRIFWKLPLGAVSSRFLVCLGMHNLNPNTLPFQNVTAVQITSYYAYYAHWTNTSAPSIPSTPTPSKPLTWKKAKILRPPNAPDLRSQDKDKLMSSEKLELLFDLLQEMKWTCGKFLFHFLLGKEDDEPDVTLSEQHNMMLQKLLSGNSRHGWYTYLKPVVNNPFSKPKKVDEWSLFSLDPDPKKMKATLPSITAMSVVLV
jgi:hypothetical protein